MNMIAAHGGQHNMFSIKFMNMIAAHGGQHNMFSIKFMNEYDSSPWRSTQHV